MLLFKNRSTLLKTPMKKIFNTKVFYAYNYCHVWCQDREGDNSASEIEPTFKAHLARHLRGLPQ